MKKLLICASLLLVLVLAVVACNNESNEGTTTGGTTDAVTEDKTEAPTTGAEETTAEETTNEETTAEETTPEETTPAETEPEYYELEDERVGNTGSAVDSAIVNNADATAADNKIDIAAGTDRVNIGIRGWVGFSQAIKSFGYRIDDEDPVFSNDFTMSFENDDDKTAIGNAGGENALRFKILVPALDLSDGEHEIAFLAQLKDGKKVIIATYTVTLSDYAAKDDADTGFKNWSGDTFYFNGEMYFDTDGQFATKLEAQGNIVPVEPGEKHDSCATRGWIGFDQPIKEFGYRINYGTPVFGDFKVATEDGVLTDGNAGQYGSRFQIEIPLADLTPGDYKIFSLVKLEDDTIVIIHEFTLSIKNYEVTTDGWHTSVDFVNGKGPVTDEAPNGSAHYSGMGANTNNHESIIEDAVPTGEDSILTIGGWCLTTGGISKYVYSLDNGLTWIDCPATGYANLENNEGVQGVGESQGFTDFAANATFSALSADLSAYAGQKVTVTFAAIRAEDGTLCIIGTVKDVQIMGTPDDPSEDESDPTEEGNTPAENTPSESGDAE